MPGVHSHTTLHQWAPHQRKCSLLGMGAAGTVSQLLTNDWLVRPQDQRPQRRDSVPTYRLQQSSVGTARHMFFLLIHLLSSLLPDTHVHLKWEKSAEVGPKTDYKMKSGLLAQAVELGLKDVEVSRQRVFLFFPLWLVLCPESNALLQEPHSQGR